MRAALAVAMNVYGGTITSSPGPMPSALRATDSAIVPFTVAIAWRAAWSLANSTSSSLTKVPSMDPQTPERRARSSASSSSRPKTGHAAKGFVRTGVPPLMASADIETALL